MPSQDTLNYNFEANFYVVFRYALWVAGCKLAWGRCTRPSSRRRARERSVYLDVCSAWAGVRLTASLSVSLSVSVRLSVSLSVSLCTSCSRAQTNVHTNYIHLLMPPLLHLLTYICIHIHRYTEQIIDSCLHTYIHSYICSCEIDQTRCTYDSGLLHRGLG